MPRQLILQLLTEVRIITLPSSRDAQSGSVTSSQSTTNTGANSVNLIESSVSVQGAYAGSVPSGISTVTVLSLTVDYALWKFRPSHRLSDPSTSSMPGPRVSRKAFSIWSAFATFAAPRKTWRPPSICSATRET